MIRLSCDLGHMVYLPPSTGSDAPVMKDELLDANKVLSQISINAKLAGSRWPNRELCDFLSLSSIETS